MNSEFNLHVNHIIYILSILLKNKDFFIPRKLQLHNDRSDFYLAVCMHCRNRVNQTHFIRVYFLLLRLDTESSTALANLRDALMVSVLIWVYQ